MLKGRRWVVLVSALVLAAVTARLGVWQLDRAGQKIRAQTALEARSAMPRLPADALARTSDEALAQFQRRIELQGLWLPAFTVFLDNRQMDARQGFFVVTPLRLADGSAVLVQRGWLPRDFTDRSRVALPPAPAGSVAVRGRIAPGPGRIYEFAGVASGPIRQNLDLAAYARETGLTLRPVSIVQDANDGDDGPAAPPDGLLRHWAAPASDVQMHHGYAFQWFALSALTIALYVWFQIINPRRRQPAR
jgi:surfeit locus 1 family protein